MNNMFRLEVNLGSRGYGFDDNLDQLLDDVETEYGEEIKNEVEIWALNSKEKDQFENYGMTITNIG